MDKIIRVVLIFVFLLSLSGCQSLAGSVKSGLSKSWDGLKKITSKGVTSAVDSSKKRKKRLYNKKREQEINRRGYLVKKQNSLKNSSEHDVQSSKTNKDEIIMVDDDLISHEIDIKESSKIELAKKITKLEKAFLNEQKEKNRCQDEFSSFKVQFQKQIFESDNLLEKEKQMNRDLSQQLTKLKFESLEAKQKLDEIKTALIAKKEVFTSSYPVYYTVTKGDSLWKIAAKTKIYDNPYKWLEIFFANQNKIKDKDLIYPDMVLKIPRYYEYMLSAFESSANEDFLPEMKSDNKFINLPEKDQTRVDEYSDADFDTVGEDFVSSDL